MKLKLSSAIDAFVGLFSPERGLRRAQARLAVNQLKSSARDGLASAFRDHGWRSSSLYAAAVSDRLTGVWSPSNDSVNRIIGLSSPMVRSRVRQLVRDFPYFARAIRVITDYVVGPGILFQSKIKDSSGRLDRKLNQKIEDAFNFWADDADIARKLHFYEIMRLAKRQDIECGEFIIIRRHRPNDNRYLPYVLQIYEADWLTTRFDRGLGPTMAPSANRIDISQGIEYDRATGEVIAYHFTDPDSWGKPVRVLAKDVIHGFETLRPGQLRGISPFAPAVMLTNDLAEYMDAEIDAAKFGAKFVGSIKTSSPLGLAAANAWSAETDAETGKTRAIEEMENAIMKILLPGEEMNLTSNPHPPGNMTPFVRLILGMVAVTTGVPYELLSSDYAGINYSTGKVVRNDFAQSLRPIAGRHIRQFCRAAARPFFDYAVISGRLSLPGYFTDPARYIMDQWQPPGMESIDPLRETKAANDQVANGLRSPQEIARARGRDLGEIYQEIKAAADLAKEIGIEINNPAQNKTPIKNNPAALEGGKK